MEIEKLPETQVPTTTELISTVGTAAPEEFTSFLSKATNLPVGSQINEEELFAAIIENKLQAESDEAAQYYASQKEQLMSSMARADGYVSVEDVANQALRNTTNAGMIDEETSKSIYNNSFKAAQLDDNLTALYDGRGSANDPSIATASLEDAMAKSYFTLQQLEAGEIETDEMDIPTSSTLGGTTSGTQELDGEGGFLWKPESESNGNLVVLLPTELRGLVESLAIYSSPEMNPESLLEEGAFSGDEHNGNRPHYRFSKEGAEYGENLYVTATLENGETQTWNIDNGANRHD